MIAYRSITDTDTPSYKHLGPEIVLARQKVKKKRKHLVSRLEQRRHSVPCVNLVNGLVGRKAKSFNHHIAQRLSQKCEQLYSRMYGYANA